jgi:hypothetical protein
VKKHDHVVAWLGPFRTEHRDVSMQKHGLPSERDGFEAVPSKRVHRFQSAESSKCHAFDDLIRIPIQSTFS